VGVHRAVPADRRVRPVSRAVTAAVRGCDLAVQDWRSVAGDAAGVRRLVDWFNRFRQWRDAGVFEALLEGLIAEAAKRGEVDLSLVSIDSTTARAHHDAAGMHLDEDVITALEKAAAEAEKARSKGAASKNKAGRTPRPIPGGRSDGASGVGEESA
jgi:hypothetical protein